MQIRLCRALTAPRRAVQDAPFTVCRVGSGAAVVVVVQSPVPRSSHQSGGKAKLAALVRWEHRAWREWSQNRWRRVLRGARVKAWARAKLTPLSNDKIGRGRVRAGSLGDPFSAGSLFNYM